MSTPLLPNAGETETRSPVTVRHVVARDVDLIGRLDELETIRSLIIAARGGLSAALVVRGEPGIGKTSLIEVATTRQRGVRLIRADGFEAESSIPFAGLHRIGVALRTDIAGLSERHRQALNVAWGMEDGPPPDRFMVGLALLALLAAAAPVVCVVDDAHWMDVESLAVLGFVARRLTAEATVVVFSARDTDDVDVALAGIDSLRLGGLDIPSSVRLLQSVRPGGVDTYSATRIAEATGGNPLALIDLARDLDTRQITDLTLSLNPVPIGRQLEEHYLRLVRTMSDDEQLWLLVAAVQSGEQRELIDGAARRLGIGHDSADAAVEHDLVTLSDVVTFRHPLVRSAVYGAAPAGLRRRVHTALSAEATALGLVELTAWHAAEATLGSDVDVADQLAEVAGRAGRRGGLLSQARLLARAATLTPPGGARTDRLLGAAEVAIAAGAAHLAGDLLDRIDATRLDSVQRGRLLTCRARLALFIADPAVVHGPAQLLRAAQCFGDGSPRRQRALVQAFEVTMVTERELRDTTLSELGRHLRQGALTGPEPWRSVMAAASSLIAEPYAVAVPKMRAAVDVLSALDDTELPEFGFIGIAFTMALFDMPAAVRYLTRLADVARDNASLRALDATLWVRSIVDTERGDLVSAALHMDQVRELRRALGYDAENVINIAYLAWTGTPREQIEVLRDITRSMGFGGVFTSAEAALAQLDLAEGSYQSAFDRLGPLLDTPFLHPTFLHFAPFVEAAVRSGHRDEALHTAGLVEAMASASGTPWLIGLSHRCLALVATDDEQADRHYRSAIDFLDPAVVPMDSGRAHLLYGEWLRRLKRRREARAHLREALHTFERSNAPAFADRARTELTATGEQLRQRRSVAGVELGERETTVAKMAAAGSTNAEIAASLFISAHTVDYHLRKVFQKLGVSSRRQLAARFSGPD